MLLGVVIAAGGLALAAVPIGAARFANFFRFVPYATDQASVRYYRGAGVVMISAGVVVSALLR